MTTCYASRVQTGPYFVPGLQHVVALSLAGLLTLESPGWEGGAQRSAKVQLSLLEGGAGAGMVADEDDAVSRPVLTAFPPSPDRALPCLCRGTCTSVAWSADT